MVFIMNKWLNNYAYHIKITGWHFAFGLIVLAVITFRLICVQTLKVASQSCEEPGN